MNASTSDQEVPKKRQRELRLKFPLACVVLFWAAALISPLIDKLYFIGFLTQVASTLLFALFFLGWWFFNRGLPWAQKLIGFALIVGLGYVAKTRLHHTFNAFMLFRIGFPAVATVTLLWLWKARRLTLGWAVVVAALWGSFDLFRGDGFDGQLKSTLAWRWTPSAEEKFLAESHVGKPKAAAPVASVAKLEPTANEWAEFRGPQRDGVLRGTSISTNWDAAPPKLVWKKAVGPAWSSMIVVGQRLFTQEQRGPQEIVVCYDARNGDEIWTHADETRFDDSLSGIGPRATPTLVNGRLYTLGATGFLNCLEAEGGKSVWRRDIRVDSHAPTMQWGFSSSPLVYDGKIFVYAGETDKGMLAYRADTGELAWGANAGKTSYSSAQLLTVDGVKQIAMLHDGGVTGFDPATGKKLWQAGDVFPGAPRCCQPRLVSSNDLVVGPLIGLGTSSLKITHQGDHWNVATNWVTKEMKPEFPDFVIARGHAFGFDAGMFCCVNLADGKRVWKDGRYGRGQVVLLADQNLLLVASETGDLVLLAADPAAHKELGKIKAIEGKTWAGPVVQGDLIFHRNAQEMACYSTVAAPTAQKPIASARQ